MKTVILTMAIRWLIPVFIAFSLYILFRGHNHPGGGFIGGLICSIAFIFHVMVHGPAKTAHNYFTINLYFVERLPGQNFAVYFIQMLIIKRKKEQPEESENKLLKYVINIDPVYLGTAGLLLAASSGLVGLFWQEPYMAASWADFKIPVLGRPGTPILFDAGVYLLVLGMVLKMVFTMSKD